MKDIMKIVKSFKDSSILTKGGDTQTIEIETEGQRGGFLSMLLGTLSANLLGNLLSGKGVMWVIRDGDEWKKDTNLNATSFDT